MTTSFAKITLPNGVEYLWDGSGEPTPWEQHDPVAGRHPINQTTGAVLRAAMRERAVMLELEVAPMRGRDIKTGGVEILLPLLAEILP